jgi:hypothetical protein
VKSNDSLPSKATARPFAAAAKASIFVRSSAAWERKGVVNTVIRVMRVPVRHLGCGQLSHGCIRIRSEVRQRSLIVPAGAVVDLCSSDVRVRQVDEGKRHLSPRHQPSPRQACVFTPARSVALAERVLTGTGESKSATERDVPTRARLRDHFDTAELRSRPSSSTPPRRAESQPRQERTLSAAVGRCRVSPLRGEADGSGGLERPTFERDIAALAGEMAMLD